MRHFTNFCLLLIIIYPYLILALLPLVSVDFSCFLFYLESLHSKMKKKNSKLAKPRLRVSCCLFGFYAMDQLSLRGDFFFLLSFGSFFVS